MQIKNKIACLTFFLSYCFFTLSGTKHKPLIVIDPSGDIHNPGRTLPDCFERGFALQCAESLKQKIESTKKATVILTRSAGTIASHERSSQMSNQLNADLYIHLSFFPEAEIRNHFYLYSFSYGFTTPLHKQDLNFCPYEEAHRYALSKTTSYANCLFDYLDSTSEYVVTKPLAFPHAQLVGIMCPAISCEIGIRSITEKETISSIISEAVLSLLNTHL